MFYLFLALSTTATALPSDNPAADLKLEWVDSLPWKIVVSLADFPGNEPAQRIEAAQKALAAKGGGTLFFPAGTYTFREHIQIGNGILWRGETPAIRSAKEDGYDPPTKFEFPRYLPSLQGTGTPNGTAFKGIYLEKPESDSNCGIVNIAINRGHIAFGEGEGYKSGKNRIVFGCVLRNAAVIGSTVPDLKAGQHAWQRFTDRHFPAVGVNATENILAANNRLPKSADDNFLMKDYLLIGKNKEPVVAKDGVLFDYDNRPGFYINSYGIGASGGQDPAGTPDSHPHGFRKGIVIRDNYLFATGRCPISFTGDGTICSFNVIRIPPGIVRPTANGIAMTFGSSTNDNRAVQMRGYRWTVEGNDYQVASNLAYDGKYKINDGEGLMHEGHVNSGIRHSKVINNKGNAYISIFHTGSIDGLIIKGNDIRTPGGIEAIYVVSHKSRDTLKHECKNVVIEANITAGTGIMLRGEPAENNVIRNNKHIGDKATLTNKANAKVEKNDGYELK
jgi:hypothetical protein